MNESKKDFYVLGAFYISLFTERRYMGAPNAAFNTCMKRKEYFADCFNIWAGRKIIKPEKLFEINPVISGVNLDGKGTYEKRNDVKMSYGEDKEHIRAVLCIENQTTVNPAMAVRNYIYDAYGYDDQLRQIRRVHRMQKAISGDEYVAGFSRKDKLVPHVTLCVYSGDKPWDVGKNLKDFMAVENIPYTEREIISPMIADSRLCILDIRRLPEKAVKEMDTELKHLFGILKCSKSRYKMEVYVKKNMEELCDMDEDIYNAIASMTNIHMLDEVKSIVKNENGGINMCKAFNDWSRKERYQGRKAGRVEDILELLEDYGTVPEAVRNRILKERNLEILKKWLKLAARTHSIEEFCKGMEMNY
ncbi:MAG: hypothetical protein PUF12_12410 [Thermoflexaceae bacterium]|nr:hypothetical protein [Thermoflexaceae bacterium]